MPQETVILSTLFLICINDLPSRVQSSVPQSADDCVQIKSDLDRSILQQDLASLSDWENYWLMEFYRDISRRRKPLLDNYTLKDTVLQLIDSTTYLGVEISKDLSWARHIDKTV